MGGSWSIGEHFSNDIKLQQVEHGIRSFHTRRAAAFSDGKLRNLLSRNLLTVQRLDASAIEFGFRSAEHRMVSMYHIDQQDVEVALSLDRTHADNNCLNINFRIPARISDVNEELGYYRLHLKLNRLSSVFLSTEGHNSFLVIPSDLPPEMYRKTADIRSTHQKGASNWSEWDAWIRQTDIVLDKQLLRQSPGRLENEDMLIHIGLHHLLPYSV